MSGATAVVPMFPLGTVLFPHQPLPLHVFEERYRAMVEDCLAAGDGPPDTASGFGVVLIERGSEVGGGDVRFGVGTLAQIVDVRRFDDGRYALLVRGTQRLRVTRWLPDDPYPRAEVTFVDEGAPAPGSDVGALAVAARDLLGDVVALRASVLGTEAVGLDGLEELVRREPVVASYALALTAGLGPLDAQALLDHDAVDDRLERLIAMLTEERSVLQGQLGR